jgi:surface polysaccharide O-acyltransferase-like enzyme
VHVHETSLVRYFLEFLEKAAVPLFLDMLCYIVQHDKVKGFASVGNWKVKVGNVACTA